MELMIVGLVVGLSAATCLIYRVAAALQERK
jgi:F0F1-type ATP synthase assembly protein I